MSSSIQTFLAQGRTLVLDGGLATALEAKGHNLNHPLWSGILLKSNPSAIQTVHREFYEAGADVAITASYQTSIRGLRDHLEVTEQESVELIRRSVQVAAAAREEVIAAGCQRKLFVAGSVGPYGAFLANGAEYTGDYGDVSADELQDFHRGRIIALLGAGADILACETMPNIFEIEVLCDLLRAEFSDCQAWLSCTVKDAAHLSDGTPFEKLAAVVQGVGQICAVGFNCIPLDIAGQSVQCLRSYTALPLVVYPNSGETWDGKNKVWLGDAAGGEHVGVHAKQWRDSGAQLIGGCCRMSNEDIASIVQSMK